MLKKLNLGCGSQVPEGWINVDYAIGARLSRIPLFRGFNRKVKLFRLDWSDRIFIHNLTRRFPWKDGSIDVVYMSHTLEHFSRDDGRAIVNECYRVLKKGGVIRILVPDLSFYVIEYSRGRIRADEFVEHLGVGCVSRKNWGRIRNMLAPLFTFPHKCMYDTPALLRILGETGFDAKAKGPYESAIEDIHAIELEGRTKNAAIVEGTKL